MDRTPAGNHEIQKISGDADDITTRGGQIESLGIQMKEAAGVLELVKDGAQTRGKSLESIKDSVGDAAGDLRTAGERYEPSGAHLKAYGLALSTAQSSVDVIVPEAERLWAVYQTKLGEWTEAKGSPVPDPQAPADPAHPDPAGERQDGINDAETAKNRAYEDWELEAGKYDAPYESWERAYEAARSGLQTANDDGIEDSFWDDALPAIDVILTVLSYAGMILAVAAIIIGGPLIAIIAAVVGVLTLALTIWKFAAGRGDKWDVIVAVIGVLPFGKIAGTIKGVAKAAGPAAKLGALGKGSKAALTDMAGLTNVRQLKHLRDVTSTGRLRQVLHGDGSVNTNGTARLRQRFAAMAGATDNSTIRQRLFEGQESVLSRNVHNAFSGGTATVRSRVTTVLGETNGGRVVQELIDGGASAASRSDRALNLLDVAAKPGGSFIYDRARGGWGF